MFPKLTGGVSPVTVSHYNALPVMDIFANVQQRDLGGVAADVEKVIKQNSQHLPPGVTIELSGQVLTMNTSFQNLEIGIAAAVIFVYLLMAMNFQSWTDPFIILDRAPRRLCGHRVDAVPDPDHFQCAVLDGCADDDWGGDGQQHTPGHLRQ